MRIDAKPQARERYQRNLNKVGGMLVFGAPPRCVATDDAQLVSQLVLKYGAQAEHGHTRESVGGFFVEYSERLSFFANQYQDQSDPTTSAAGAAGHDLGEGEC